MSEADSSHSDDSLSALETGVPTSAGVLLRAAREAQGLHIAALAVTLKVPVKKLEALEADRFDLLPDIVFVRALAASVCRTLKIDPAQILVNLPNTTVAHLNSKMPVMSVPFRAPRDRLGSSLRDQLSKPLIFVVLLLLLGVLVLVFVPLPQLAALGGSSTSEAVVEGKQTLSPSAVETTMAVLVDASSAATASTSSMVNSPIVISQAAAASTAVAPAITPNLPLPIVSASGEAVDLMVFTARGASWVEVVDATASVKLRKTLANGDVVSASGVAPLSVVVGRADVVDVQLRGKPFYLIPVARENVARFEVK